MPTQITFLNLHGRFNRHVKTSSLMTLSALAGMTAMYHINQQNNTRKTQTESSSSSPAQHANVHYGIIETDFTDKIASKPYLNYHNTFSRDDILTSARNSSKKIWNKLARSDRNPSVDDYFDKDNIMAYKAHQLKERPKGVPRRIRVLSIDVPEFREVFDGECRVNLSRIYPDDIAPPSCIPRKRGVVRPLDDNRDNVQAEEKEGNDSASSSSSTSSSLSSPSTSSKNNRNKNKPLADSKTDQVDNIEIIQKSLARSLVRCRNVQSKRIGVELLEASVYDLNPHNMRRTYQFGSYRYDPGKYGSMQNSPNDMIQRRMTSYGGVPRGNPRDVAPKTDDKSASQDTHNENTTKNVVQDQTQQQHQLHRKPQESTIQAEETVLANDDDEVDAPWNQYAWIEEMELRVHGRIPFGANVERTSWLTRKLFGPVYRTTVKMEPSSPLLWFIPSFLGGNKIGGYEGIDGDYGKKKRTINRASSKPHAVIADGSAMQRVPGSLRYLTKCCQEADVPLFIINDPRVWGGNTHRDLESAANDMRKTIKARMVANALTIKEGSMFERGRKLGNLESETKWQLKDAGRRTREAVQSAAARLQKEREENWSELDGKELLQRLIDRQVLRVEGGHLEDAGAEEAFGNLCKQYVANKHSADSSAKSETSNTNSGDGVLMDDSDDTPGAANGSNSEEAVVA